MLIAADITTGARILLNEMVEAFWYDTDFTEWLKNAALDISAKTLCYEVTEDISLVTSTQEYNVTTEYLKIHGARYNNEPRGLLRYSPWMEGIQEVPIAGPPKYYYEFARKFGVSPKPTVSENGHIVTIYCSSSTSDITKIYDKYRTAAILYVTGMGLLKERQYLKSTQIFATYEGNISFDRQDNFPVKIAPPPLDTYVIRPSVQVGVPVNAT